MTSRDDRGMALTLKLSVPRRIWRPLTRPGAAALGMIPHPVKYSVGLALRRNKLPYAAVEPGDTVFQIGAPRDLLAQGRSRAAYFAHLVSASGRLVVMEPDARNCEMLERFCRSRGLADRTLIVNAGAWREETTLRFYENREHPASARLADAPTAAFTATELRDRGFREIEVPVSTVDQIVADHSLPAPKLVSITANGVEKEILEGMRQMLAAGQPEYISLAVTGEGYIEHMAALGFAHSANDDRGFTFRRRMAAAAVA